MAYGATMLNSRQIMALLVINSVVTTLIVIGFLIFD
jgi:hypothetical protein